MEDYEKTWMTEEPKEEKGPHKNDWAYSFMVIIVVTVIALSCLALNGHGPWR